MPRDSTKDKSKPGQPLIIQKSIDWPSWNLSGSVKNIRLVTDGENNIWATPVLIVDPNKEGTIKLGTPIPASIFRRALTIAAGNTTIWTPAANRSIRLQGIAITVPGNTIFAAAGNLVIIVRGGNGLFDYRATPYCPLAVVNNQLLDEIITFDPPLNCFTPNEILLVNLTLPGAAAGGSIYIHAWGYEE